MPSEVFQAPAVRTAGWGDEKQLVAATAAVAGALLLAEQPIAFVPTQPDEDELGPWLLLEAVLSSAGAFTRVDAADLKLTKWPLGAEDEERLSYLAGKYRRNPRKLAQLYHRVAANNIRYAGEDLIGFGIWPVLSRSNHSCDPNARIGAAAAQPLVELLLATRPIAAGEAICWNYFSDPAFLDLAWRERNALLLQHFQFICQCPRCASERPAALGARPRAEVVAYLRR